MKRDYCNVRGCHAQLNPYGVCPNLSQHLAEDELKSEKIKTEKEEKGRKFQALLDSIFKPEGDDKL